MLNKALTFRHARAPEKAKEAFVKAARGHEMLSSYPYFWSLVIVQDILYPTLQKWRISNNFNKFTRPWDAAKHMESAAALAKEVGNWGEVSDFYRMASEYYTECGRSQPATDALAKGARLWCSSCVIVSDLLFEKCLNLLNYFIFYSALEEAVPEDAIQMYADACTIFEEDEKMQMAFDLYRSAMSLYIKLNR